MPSTVTSPARTSSWPAPGVGESSFDEHLVKSLAQDAISDWFRALIILRIFP